MGNASAGPSEQRKPIKRARAVRVCTRCKVQKLKCDREEPCESCSRASLGHLCVYNAWGHREEATSSDLSHRVAQLEAELNVRRAAQQPPISINPVSLNPLDHIVSSIPPSDACHHYLELFAKFDVNYRTTHIPSFRRRADALLSRRDGGITISDTPLLALILIAMAIGAEREANLDPSSTNILALDLDQLYARSIDLIETIGGDMIDIDYVKAIYLRTVRLKHGGNASPSLTWITLGKALAAARWLRLDRVEEGVWSFELEMKKRLWCQITTSERLLMEMLHLSGPCSPPLTPAQIPMIVDDASLETGDIDSEGIAEWSYVAIKLRYVHITAAVNALLPSDGSEPTLSQLTTAHSLLIDFESTFDAHFRVDRTPSFDEPPWAYGQGCVVVMGMMHATILLYEKGFRSTDPTVRSTCLEKALNAAERLIKTFELLYTHVLFKWPDGRPLNIWACGGKIFEAAIAIASVLAVEPENQSKERRTLFEEAIRSLELMTAEPTKCIMNDQSLAILRRVKVQLDQGLNPFIGDVGKEKDPFTGGKLDARAIYTIPTQEEWLDWNQWESIFPGLLTDA